MSKEFPMSQKTFELFPGVHVSENATNVYVTIKHDFPQFERNHYVDGWPEQRIRDKVSKNFALDVLRSKWNMKDKSITYIIMTGPTDVGARTISYKDICKSCQWKSFEFSENMQLVIPVKKEL